MRVPPADLFFASGRIRRGVVNCSEQPGQRCLLVGTERVAASGRHRSGEGRRATRFHRCLPCCPSGPPAGPTPLTCHCFSAIEQSSCIRRCGPPRRATRSAPLRRSSPAAGLGCEPAPPGGRSSDASSQSYSRRHL